MCFKLTNHYFCFILGTTIITNTVFWCYGGLYMIMDITNKPVALRKYKVQPGSNEPLDKGKFTKVLFTACLIKIII